MNDAVPTISGSFAGTAEYYALYRWPYPTEVLRHVERMFALNGSGHLLDVGCGTGLLTFALHPYFKTSRGVDLDSSMVEVAKREAKQRGTQGITFELAAAEQMALPSDFYRLITFGTSFHWMNRTLVGNRIRPSLVPGGGIAVITTFSLWQESASWQTIVNELIFAYTGHNRRVASAVAPDHTPHAEILRGCGFVSPTVQRFEDVVTYSLETLLGFLSSTSFASKTRLGDKWPMFENDLRRELLAFDSGGAYTETVTYEVVSAFAE